MSNKFKIPVLIILAVFVYRSCTKDEAVNIGLQKHRPMMDLLPKEQWKISYFKLNGIDKTEDFDLDTFRFTREGNVAASNALTMANGNWSTRMDPLSFFIEFKKGIRMSQVNGEWKIKKVNGFAVVTTRPGLTRSLTDVLEFEKIEKINSYPIAEQK